MEPTVRVPRAMGDNLFLTLTTSSASRQSKGAPIVIQREIAAPRRSGHVSDGGQGRARPMDDRSARFRSCLDPGPAYHPCGLAQFLGIARSGLAARLGGASVTNLSSRSEELVRRLAALKFGGRSLRRRSSRASWWSAPLATTSLPLDRPCPTNAAVYWRSMRRSERRRRVLGLAIHRRVGAVTGDGQPATFDFRGFAATYCVATNTPFLP